VPPPVPGASGGSGLAPPLVGDLVGVSCANATSCVAVGSPGAVASSVDGGGTWTLRPEVAQVGAFTSVACFSSQDCVAAGYGASGGALETTTNAGASWSPVTVPGAVAALNGVSCSGGSLCVAVGDSLGGVMVEVSTNGGVSWTSAQVPGGMIDLQAVSCASPTTCVAVGEGNGTTSLAAALVTTNAGGDLELGGTAGGGAVPFLGLLPDYIVLFGGGRSCLRFPGHRVHDQRRLHLDAVGSPSFG